MRENRPSSTAALIAAATVFLARDPRLADLVPAGAAPRCERCIESLSAVQLAAVRAVSHPALRWTARLAEGATVPGLLLHFMLRKRWIEEAVRAALAEGCVQVAVVGAGFDTLALRLARQFPRASFIEVDHPATQERKRAAGREDVPGNLHFVPADLSRTPLQDALSRAAYRPGARSVFVIEGLLMYLTGAEVDGAFAALAGLQGPGGRVIFTVMEPTPDGRSAFHNATPLVTRLLARWSEPFRSALARADTARFLGRFGYGFRGLADSEILRERYLAPTGRQRLVLARGEIVLVAEREGR